MGLRSAHGSMVLAALWVAACVDQGAAACRDECADEASATCTIDGRIISCVRAPDGCLVRARPEPCPSGRCEAGACVPLVRDCVDACDEEGRTECAGPSVRTCVRFGACLAWSLPIACEAGECVAGVCATCSDGRANGQETDVDCGGICPRSCAVGKACRAYTDCVSGGCSRGECAPASSCGNGRQDGEESAKDCGGGCAPCVTGLACRADADCVTRLCRGGSCREPTCLDGVQNQDETDVDCGGRCLVDCSVGARCRLASDCASGLCEASLCAAPDLCANGVQDGAETDVDCGGRCRLCASGRSCQADVDCRSSSCVSGRCAEPTCGDGRRNLDESDVDCGGSCAVKCDVDHLCRNAEDCLSGVCADGVCRTCDTPCPQADASRCVGDLVQICTQDANGCRAWSAATACAAGLSCSGVTGACEPVGCGSVTADGECVSASRIRRCLTTTGAGRPLLLENDCAPGESCSVIAGVGAQCVPAISCAGAAFCAADGSLSTCVQGVTVATACAAGCSADNPVAAYCSPAPGLPVTTLTGNVQYEWRWLSFYKNGWTTPSARPAAGFLVLSYAMLPGATEATLLDSTVTSSDPADAGSFTVAIQDPPAAGDYITVTSFAASPTGLMRLVVADPDLAAGSYSAGTAGASPKVWSWSYSTQILANTGGAILIDTAHGAAAAGLFSEAKRVIDRTDSFYGRDGMTLLLWLGFGAEWDCGNCFARYTTQRFNQTFVSQIWVSGDTNVETYWSLAVVDHELGHWAMNSFGTQPSEAGRHFMTVPTFPGQAWSEGFATWFSSAMRDDPIYYARGQNLMFWADLGLRGYAYNYPWQRPDVADPDGLQQKVDENEVAAILWEVSSVAGIDTVRTQLGSDRMRIQPFGRGYTTKTWDVYPNGLFLNVVDTGRSTPFLADMLDALACAGVATTTIDGATEPTVHYPYDATQPICQ